MLKGMGRRPVRTGNCSPHKADSGKYLEKCMKCMKKLGSEKRKYLMIFYLLTARRIK